MHSNRRQDTRGDDDKGRTSPSLNDVGESLDPVLVLGVYQL